MIDYLAFFAVLIIGSLWCFGIYFACQYKKTVEHKVYPDKNGWEKVDTISEKSLLWWFGYFCEALPWYLGNPLCKCVTCMASIHGSLVFLLFYPNELTLIELIPSWIIYVGALAGLNQLIANRFLDE